MSTHSVLLALDAAPALDRLVVGRGDGDAFLLRLSTGEVLAILSGHADAVCAAAFVDGGLLWTLDEAGHACLWRADTGVRVADVDTGHGPGGRLGALGGDLVATAGGDGCVRVWQAATHALVANVEATLQATTGRKITSLVAVGPHALAVGFDSGEVRAWRRTAAGWPGAASWCALRPGPVDALAWTSGAPLACAHGGGITWLDVHSGEARATCALPGSVRVHELAYGPSGEELFGARSDDVVTRWHRQGDAWVGEALDAGGVLGNKRPTFRLRALEAVLLSTNEYTTLRATRTSPGGGGVAAVLAFFESGNVEMRTGIGGRNPGMWSFLFPRPDAAARMAEQTKALARVVFDALDVLDAPDGTSAPAQAPGSRPDPDIDALFTGDAEQRHAAAAVLAATGDARALPVLEEVALADEGSFDVEGAFVDDRAWVYLAAREALRALYARVELRPADEERLRATLARRGLPGARVLGLFDVLGHKARPIVEPLLAHADPLVRLRAQGVLGRLDRRPPQHVLWLDDEAVRRAATEQDVYTNLLVVKALERFREEPSVHVRRGICELWLRYRHRMGGRLDVRTALAFLDDADAEICARVARHILGLARDDRPGRARLGDAHEREAIRQRVTARLVDEASPVRRKLFEELLAALSR